ncbi:DNA repair protein RecO [Marinobacteraceae bacterium S3BR75-40.1]
MTRVEQEPAYVLHRRAYRETSLLVSLFSLEYGRMSLVARGATRPKSPWKAQLQPFQPLIVDWQGRGDLKNLAQVEVQSGPTPRGTRALYCGFYLNELMERLLPAQEPSRELFGAYIEALHGLAQAEDLEQVLRRFEWVLIDVLGYGFSWDVASDLEETVQAGRSYGYDPQQGIVAEPGQSILLSGLPGDTLLTLAQGHLDDPGARRMAKRVTRALIDYLLQGRPLNSRKLFNDKHGE